MCKKWMNADKLLKNAGKPMYVYSVDIKEHMKVINKVQHQLDKQKEMWDKLKAWVSYTQPRYIDNEFIAGVYTAYSIVKDSMQKLEEEDE